MILFHLREAEVSKKLSELEEYTLPMAIRNKLNSNEAKMGDLTSAVSRLNEREWLRSKTPCGYSMTDPGSILEYLNECCCHEVGVLPATFDLKQEGVELIVYRDKETGNSQI
jgi:hypothetical protein